MENLLTQIEQATNTICFQLNGIKEALSHFDWFGVLGPWVLSIISAFFGYFISSRNEKRAFKRNCHIKYLSFTNEFLCDINSLITEFANLQKLANNLLGQTLYTDLNDYNLLLNIIREARKKIDKMYFETSYYSSQREYKEKFVQLSNDLLNFNKIIDICTKYQKEAANYYYLITKKLRKEHSVIIKNISDYSKNNMQGFKIEEFKKKVIEHINHINEEISGERINEPNWFDQNGILE